MLREPRVLHFGGRPIRNNRVTKWSEKNSRSVEGLNSPWGFGARMLTGWAENRQGPSNERGMFQEHWARVSNSPSRSRSTRPSSGIVTPRVKEDVTRSQRGPHGPGTGPGSGPGPCTIRFAQLSRSWTNSGHTHCRGDPRVFAFSLFAPVPTGQPGKLFRSSSWDTELAILKHRRVQWS